VSGRLQVLPRVNLRGAFSTGFRAPTPGQQDLVNTSQNPAPGGGASIETNGTIPSNNAIAALKGGKPLKPERSVNISFGLVTKPFKNLTFSVDAYQIDVRDRLGLSQRYTLTPEEQQALVNSGIAAAQGLTSFNFFVNGYETRTRGLDLVLSYKHDLHTYGQVTLTGAANINDTKVLSFDAGVISARQRQYIEKRLPKHVETASLGYSIGGFYTTLRGRFYGPWTEPFADADANGNLPFNQRFGSELFVDLSAGYAFSKQLSLTIGAENILDNYPDRARFPNTVEDAAAGKITTTGRKYPSQRPYEADGGRVFARLDAHF